MRDRPEAAVVPGEHVDLGGAGATGSPVIKEESPHTDTPQSCQRTPLPGRRSSTRVTSRNRDRLLQCLRIPRPLQ